MTRMRTLSSLSMPEDSEEMCDVVEAVSPDPNPEEQAAASERLALGRIAWGPLMSHLSVRHQLVMVSHYRDRLTLPEIAVRCGVRTARVSQTHTEALSMLRDMFARRPVPPVPTRRYWHEDISLWPRTDGRG